MARPGITYEEVAAAAEAITATGEHPSIQAVREHLETGSPNTIQKHLKRWRGSRPAQVVAAVELPPALTQALHEQISMAAAAARAESQTALAEAQAEADELASVGEALEDERDNLLTVVNTLTAERDELRILLGQRDQQIAHQEEVIKREQNAAEAARIETAKCQTDIEKWKETAADLAERLGKADAMLEKAQTEAVAAKQAAAVATAQLESERTKSADLTQRLASAEKRAEEAVKEAKQASEQASSARIAEQRAQAQIEAAQREMASYKETAQEARAEARKASDEAAACRGQLAAALERVKPQATNAPT